MRVGGPQSRMECAGVGEKVLIAVVGQQHCSVGREDRLSEEGRQIGTPASCRSEIVIAGRASSGRQRLTLVGTRALRRDRKIGGGEDADRRRGEEVKIPANLRRDITACSPVC